MFILIDWYLTPTLAVCHLYRGISYILTTRFIKGEQLWTAITSRTVKPLVLGRCLESVTGQVGITEGINLIGIRLEVRSQ
jgi:hypothetical protein